MSLETNSSTTLRIPKGFEKFGEDLFYHLSSFLSVIDLISLSHTCNFLHTNCKPLVYPQFKTRATAHILNLKKKKRHKRNKKNIHGHSKNINTTELLKTIQNPRETNIGIGGSFPLYVLLNNPKWDYNDIDVFHTRDTRQYNYGGKCTKYYISSRYDYETCRHGYFNLIFYGLNCDVLNPTGMKDDSTVVDSCFDKFDISVVKVIWSADSLNIKNVRDIYHKTMHVNFSKCRIDRIIKYKQRGFKISKKHESRINQREYKRKIYNMHKFGYRISDCMRDHILNSYARGCRLYDIGCMYEYIVKIDNLSIPLTETCLKNFEYLLKKDIESITNQETKEYCKYLLKFKGFNLNTLTHALKFISVNVFREREDLDLDLDYDDEHLDDTGLILDEDRGNESD